MNVRLFTGVLQKIAGLCTTVSTYLTINRYE